MIELKNIEESDLDKVIWRYLTFPKYISLITYGALWFAKLNTFDDGLEGAIPQKTAERMHKENHKWKKITSNPDMQKHIDDWPRRNVKDGRELKIVNCWFLGDAESPKMWREYAKNNQGVAIKSTIRKLRENVGCVYQYSKIGKVQYVDLPSLSISTYEASQAMERAFYKNIDYAHEQEVRIVTMNYKTPWCLNPNGKPLSPAEYSGSNANNFDKPGLYIQAVLEKMITATVLAPDSSERFEFLINRIAEQTGVGNPVLKSSLKNVFI